MAAQILHVNTVEPPSTPIIGRQLFDVITAGMYDNPLMVYREYIQNAVDSIDLAMAAGILSQQDAKVDIRIGRGDRTITIEDNGAGLSNDLAEQVLISLGCSPKESTSQRGFRGIGRLGGLAYCERLVFETRSREDEYVSVVVWDKSRIDKLSEQNRVVGLEETLRTVSHCDVRDANESDPAHFFRVTMEKVIDFHSDDLMSYKKVNSYLAQVAPVPYDHNHFSFAVEIEREFQQLVDYRSYLVVLNGIAVVRPYTDSFTCSSQKLDNIRSISKFEFLGGDGKLIAVGWYANIGFYSSVPAVSNVRGLRVRLGNIEVGNQHFLTQYFTESRFSAWLIGEIHIVDRRLKPNARRDGFEHTEDLERFFEQAQQLCRFLSGLCRKASIQRCLRERVERNLIKLEEFCHSETTFIDKAHYRVASENVCKLQRSTSAALDQLGDNKELNDRYLRVDSLLMDKLESPTFLAEFYDGRSVRDDEKGKKVADTLAQISHIIMNDFDRCQSANELLNVVLEKYLLAEKKGGVAIASL